MPLTLHINGRPVTVEVVERTGASLRILLGGQAYHFMTSRDATGALVLDREIAPGIWRRVRGAAWHSRGAQHLQLGGHDFTVAEASGAAGAGGAAAAPLSPRAPMPGLVRQVLVKAGERVTAGQPLAVLEAMKLQLTLCAGGSAVVREVRVTEGAMVPEGAELVLLAEDRP